MFCRYCPAPCTALVGKLQQCSYPRSSHSIKIRISLSFSRAFRKIDNILRSCIIDQKASLALRVETALGFMVTWPVPVPVPASFQSVNLPMFPPLSSLSIASRHAASTPLSSCFKSQSAPNLIDSGATPLVIILICSQPSLL